MFTDSETAPDVVNPRYVARRTMNPPKITKDVFLGSIKFFFLQKFLEDQGWEIIRKVDKFSFFYRVYFSKSTSPFELEVFVHHQSPDNNDWVESIAYGEEIIDLSIMEGVVRKKDVVAFSKLLSEVEKARLL